LIFVDILSTMEMKAAWFVTYWLLTYSENACANEGLDWPDHNVVPRAVVVK
jgi:hypothetical protein